MSKSILAGYVRLFRTLMLASFAVIVVMTVKGVTADAAQATATNIAVVTFGVFTTIYATLVELMAHWHSHARVAEPTALPATS